MVVSPLAVAIPVPFVFLYNATLSAGGSNPEVAVEIYAHAPGILGICPLKNVKVLVLVINADLLITFDALS